MVVVEQRAEGERDEDRTALIELYYENRCFRNRVDGTMSDSLSKPQWALSTLFVEKERSIVEHDDIITAIFPDVQQKEGITPAALCALVRRVRERLSEVSDRTHIKTVRGWGWKFSTAGFEE